MLGKPVVPASADYGWGYPFDWVTRNGVIKAGTPLITTTPYAYEAFLQVQLLQPDAGRKKIIESIVRHVCTDIKDYKSLGRGQHEFVYAAGSGRRGECLVVSRLYAGERGKKLPGRRFVAGHQPNGTSISVLERLKNADGSWPYAKRRRAQISWTIFTPVL